MDEMKVNGSSPTRHSSTKASVSPKPPAGDSGGPDAKAGQVQARQRATVGVKEQQKNIEVSQEVRAAEQREAANSKESEVKAAVKQLNDYVQSEQRSLQFTYDSDSGRAIISVVDSQTKELIRQIPEEYAIELARNLNHSQPVNLVNTKV